MRPATTTALYEHEPVSFEVRQLDGFVESERPAAGRLVSRSAVLTMSLRAR